MLFLDLLTELLSILQTLAIIYSIITLTTVIKKYLEQKMNTPNH